MAKKKKPADTPAPPAPPAEVPPAPPAAPPPAEPPPASPPAERAIDKPLEGGDGFPPPPPDVAPEPPPPPAEPEKRRGRKKGLAEGGALVYSAIPYDVDFQDGGRFHTVKYGETVLPAAAVDAAVGPEQSTSGQLAARGVRRIYGPGHPQEGRNSALIGEAELAYQRFAARTGRG